MYVWDELCYSVELSASFVINVTVFVQNLLKLMINT